MEKYYKVSEEELRELLDAYYRLVALERSGVDNWIYYSDSFHDFIQRYNEENPDRKIEWMDEIAEIELANYDVVGEE